MTQKYVVSIPGSSEHARFVAPGERKQRIVLQDVPENVMAILADGGRYTITTVDGRKAVVNVTVNGLAAAVFLDAAFGIGIDMSIGELLTGIGLHGSAEIEIDFVSDAGLLTTSWLTVSQKLSVDMDVDNLLVLKYLGACDVGAKLGLLTNGLTVARLTVVNDWADYYMNALSEMTMQDMIYTEAT